MGEPTKRAWFKRRLQLRVAGVDARGVSLSSFAPRKHALSRSERRLYFNPSSCYPRNTQSEPCRFLGMVQSQVTGGHAERGFLTAAQHRLQRRRTGSGDQPRSLARGHVHRYPRPDLPGRPPVRVGVDTASTDCCAQKRYYLEILRNFFPKNGQRLRPVFPPNCKFCVKEILKTQHCRYRE